MLRNKYGWSLKLEKQIGGSLRFVPNTVTYTWRAKLKIACILPYRTKHVSNDWRPGWSAGTLWYCLKSRCLLQRDVFVSHQSSPHRCPGGTQRGVLAENGVHEPAHETKTRTSYLENPEEEHALLVQNEVPVSVHFQVFTRWIAKGPCLSLVTGEVWLLGFNFRLSWCSVSRFGRFLYQNTRTSGKYSSKQSKCWLFSFL